MARQKSLADSHCPVARATDIVGDRWALLIVRDAFDGVRRFGDFRTSLGVASNILSDRLRMLVEAGVFDVVPASDGSAYQEYVLTKKGEGLFPVIVMLRQWGEANLFARGEPHSVLVDRKTGRALRKLALRQDDGRPLKPADTFVKKVGEAGDATPR
ncbi:helix-turn-helix transcriptional regulator [Burkholderia multivorans]|uniref:Helix-turn-helix transcriptional regulator n=1 Tax=Burkholderia multivorans TaxID=87883 RepID=A0AAP2HHC2_9BURK|nr:MULTISPECIES: helix-turn-helix domain-containing protein [Burkholderia]AJY16341.1 hxlR-like helix-turn-helix family protein [Burkholderia multivorans ATCC BAA-247]AVR19723.1 transcriptional regulator [Burkholderia multivorans]EJO58300.1 transcriptional regulator, HxlR family [Burkholderia multivorans ATCC BAA-247]KOE24945.1 transcriptional regulator [Burkholderia multivorans R-20526]KVS11218.1 transcriptional regulator [Burkholderia multivorans]